MPLSRLSSFNFMKVLGITGGVGMGKSTAESLLVERGLPVIDTDHLARVVVEPGQPALAEIRAQFGEEFVNPEGNLRRDALAKLVFADSERRQQLESILHPRIRSLWMDGIDEWRLAGVALGAVVIPLLYETDAAPSFDATVCVACSAQLQQERLRARDWDDEEVQHRIAAQWPVDEKLAAADYVVWTDGDLMAHGAQWERVLSMMQGVQKTGGHC